MIIRTLITLTDSDDIFTLSGDLYEIRALAGFDQLTITGDDNLILGGAGFLRATVIGDNNTVRPGGDGSYVQTVGNGLLFDGGAGADTLIAFPFDGSNVFVGSDDGTFIGRRGADSANVVGNRWQIQGGLDGDNLKADGNDNRLFGGAGRDFVTVAGSGNIGQGGPDDDWMIVFSGSGNTLIGGAGNDNLAARAASNGNILDGGLDNDTLLTYGNNTVLIGGHGFDILSDQGAAGFRTVFQYRSLADAPISDTEFEFVVGFTPGEDVLDFSPIAARIGRALAFVGDGTFTGIWQVGVRGAEVPLPAWLVADLTFFGQPYTVVEVNGGGDLAPEMRFIVEGVAPGALTAADFILSG